MAINVFKKVLLIYQLDMNNNLKQANDRAAVHVWLDWLAITLEFQKSHFAMMTLLSDWSLMSGRLLQLPAADKNNQSWACKCHPPHILCPWPRGSTHVALRVFGKIQVHKSSKTCEEAGDASERGTSRCSQMFPFLRHVLSKNARAR